jgi:quinol monooxygenase YgiN
VWEKARVARLAATTATVYSLFRPLHWEVIVAIYAIWESRFSAARAAEGRAVTEAIWRDMPQFEGYLDHELLIDANDPGHLLVVSRWTSQEHADQSLRRYATHPNARAADSLVAEPRRRILATRAKG